jgi:hypothetical protein
MQAIEKKAVGGAGAVAEAVTEAAYQGQRATVAVHDRSGRVGNQNR